MDADRELNVCFPHAWTERQECPFAAAMKDHHVPVEYLELPSSGHGLNGCKRPLWEKWKAKSLL